MSSIQVEANKLATMWAYGSRGIDNANKSEFDKFYSMVKAKDTREEQSKALVQASKHIQSDNQRRGFMSMTRLAIDYCEVNTVCNYQLVEWELLKKIVRLHKYVGKNHNVDSQKVVRDKLSEVYAKGMSPERYNNALSAKLDALKEEYAVEIQPKEVTVEDGLLYVDTLSTEVKRAMLEKLMSDLGYELGEVA